MPEKSEKIMRYIPKRLKCAIREAYHDSDGYWIMLNENYLDVNWGTHVIHEDTINELRRELQNVEKIYNN